MHADISKQPPTILTIESEVGRNFAGSMAKLPTAMLGRALVFQVGYHPRKRTFKTHPINTHFSGMKTDLKYAFLHAFFLVCPSRPFQNLSI